MEGQTEKMNGNGTFRSLIIVVGIAVSFLLWGLLLFYSVGDKGSPPWDFGVVEDIPGESAYSTHPFPAPAPESQHVAETPSQAGADAPKEKP